ncbi:MAG: ABC transporter permease [Thermodesulfobacteriota bacterium]
MKILNKATGTLVEHNRAHSDLHEPVIIIRPTRGLQSLGFKQIWDYRQLLYFLAWRDVKVRYKQTLLGVLWVVLQPLVTVVVFSLIFGKLLKVPSGDLPYPLFVLAALLPWNYFASTLNRCSTSLLGNSNLITKVYFPRVVIPLSASLSGLVDFCVAFLTLLGLIAYFGMWPGITVLLLPAFMSMAFFTAFGFGLWLSALNVRFRDVNYLVPFLVQIWMYATPIVYGSNLIPERFSWVMALNPMTAVVEGFRWSLFGGHSADVTLQGFLFLVPVIITVVTILSGALFFRSTERTFADVI